PTCHCETCQKASRGNLPTTESQANDYTDKEIATTATQARNDGVLTAFDEIAAYNAKITQIKGQRETLLLQIEKQLKAEKGTKRKKDTVIASEQSERGNLLTMENAPNNTAALNGHCETCQKASRGNLPTTESQANDYNDNEIATTATQSRNDGVLTAFDEIAAYNAKITQMKGQRETLLLQIEKQHKSEKNAHRKARLKTLSGSLKNKIKTYRTITPLNQNPEFTPPFDIPKEWAWVKLGDLGEFKKGPFGSALTKSMFVPKSANAVKVYEQKNAIQKNEKLGDYFITKEYFENNMQGFIVKGGDIIVSCAGTIGEIYKLPENSEIGIINQALMRIRLNKMSIYEYFKVIFDFSINENSNASKGTAIKNIPPFEILKNLPIPLPPLAEQQFIAGQLEKLLDLCKKLKTKP
ncbi:MAG: restriction endonuclease subunit S, partial [Neisseriaceae bacterium]|nr:restriction endonuclease subunit S [Neisseriaceae bacterium]